MNIQVECYSGYRGDETPRAIWLGARKIVVADLLDRWIAPDHRYFKFRGDDQGIYIIRHDTASLAWELAFFQGTDLSSAPAADKVGGRS